MKVVLRFVVLTLSIAATSVSAQAKGCIKGAIVGGVAGHVAHHTLLGAAAGCVIGHHEAAKRAKEQELQDQQSPPANQAPAPAPTKPQ
jgi:outer membrane lipoprotein SlyB